MPLMQLYVKPQKTADKQQTRHRLTYLGFRSKKKGTIDALKAKREHER